MEAVGESWAYLRWNVSEVREDLNRYSILIDEDYTDNVCLCFSVHKHLHSIFLLSNNVLKAQK